MICLFARRNPGLRRFLRRYRGKAPVLIDPSPTQLADTLRTLALPPQTPSLVWYWPQRLPEALTGEGYSYGIHPSLLPAHPGPDPFFASIRNGDRYTGLSLLRLVADYDAGPLLWQARLRIPTEATAGQLSRQLDALALKSLPTLWRMLRRYANASGYLPPQQGSWAASPGPEPLPLLGTHSCTEALRLSRAASPEPGVAICDPSFGTLRLHGLRLASEFAAVQAAPGESWRAADWVCFRCRDGVVAGRLSR